MSREPLGSMLRDERRGRGSAENRENSAAALLADLERARRRVGRGFGVGGWDGPGTRSGGGAGLAAGGRRPRDTSRDAGGGGGGGGGRVDAKNAPARRTTPKGDVPIQRGAEKVLTKTKHAIRRIEHAARKVGCVIVRSYRRAPADSTSSSPSTTVRITSNHGVVCRILTTRVFLSSSSDVLARHPRASSPSCSSVSVSSCPVSSRFRARKSFRPRRTPPRPPGPQRSRIRSSSSRRRCCCSVPRRWRRRHRVTSDPPRGGRR